MTKKEIKKSRSVEDLTTKSQDKKIQELKDQIKELSTERNQLTDQNNELRINNLKQKDYFTKYREEIKITQQLKLQLAQLQKDLTIFQQDLKSAQRIIELRTIDPESKDNQEQEIDYWTYLRIGGLILLIYLLYQDQENYHE